MSGLLASRFASRRLRSAARLMLYRETVPRDRFDILPAIAQRLPRGCAVYTSNVDGQVQKAGFAEEWILECHGSIHQLQCLNQCTDAVWSAAGFKPDVDAQRCRLMSAPPVCPMCGGIARPNILMSDDWEWTGTRVVREAGPVPKDGVSLSMNALDALRAISGAAQTRRLHLRLQHTSAACFAERPVAFEKVRGEQISGNTRGQAFLYLGRHIQRFTKVFARFGRALFPGNAWTHRHVRVQA